MGSLINEFMSDGLEMLQKKGEVADGEPDLSCCGKGSGESGETYCTGMVKGLH